MTQHFTRHFYVSFTTQRGMNSLCKIVKPVTGNIARIGVTPSLLCLTSQRGASPIQLKWINSFCSTSFSIQHCVDLRIIKVNHLGAFWTVTDLNIISYNIYVALHSVKYTTTLRHEEISKRKRHTIFSNRSTDVINGSTSFSIQIHSFWISWTNLKER